LVSKKPPFYGNTEEEVLNKVTIADYSMLGAKWDKISVDIKNIITVCLNINPELRPSTSELKQMVWFKK